MMWFFLAICSAILSAVSAVLQKKILFRLSAVEFSFLVSTSILFFSSFIPFTIDITSISQSTLLILIGKSFLSGGAFLLVMNSLKYNEISNALPLLGITPAAAALLSLIILGEALQHSEWIGIGLVLTGIYIIEKRPVKKIVEPISKPLFSKNHFSIFGAVVLFAVSSVFDKMLVSNLKVEPLLVLFYQHCVYFTVFGVLLIIQKSSWKALFRNGREQIVLIAAVALLTIAYRFTQLEATKLAPVALVLAVKRTSILYASFFGGKLFSEERLMVKLLGAAFIVAAGFFILRNVG